MIFRGGEFSTGELGISSGVDRVYTSTALVNSVRSDSAPQM
jgi:hypothetical protein